MSQGFTSELHVLCGEAKWAQVKNLVVSIMNGKKAPEPGPADKNEQQTQLDELKAELRKTEGPFLWTPLMISCVRAPIDVLAALVQAEPEACLIPDKSGSLPIHVLSGWRRGPFVEILLKVMVETAPRSLIIQNSWGLTPIHSMLDSKLLAPIGCLRIFTSQAEYSDMALSIPDYQGRLPLHIAAEKNVPSDYLQIMVETYREAALEPNSKGDLPCHVLHQVGSGLVPTESMEALLIPLALGTARRRRSAAANQGILPSSWQQLHNLTKQAQAQYGDRRTPDKRLTVTQEAARILGGGGGPHQQNKMLPIHLAAFYGVKLEIIKGVCRNYAQGVGSLIHWPLEMDTAGPSDVLEEDDNEDAETEEHMGSSSFLGTETTSLKQTVETDESTTKRYASATQRTDESPSNTDPANSGASREEQPWEEESLITRSTEDLWDGGESQEDSIERQQVETRVIETRPMCALEIFERGRAAHELNVTKRTQSAERSQQVLLYFSRRSDLILAFDPSVSSSETGEIYLDNKDRLRRLERLIRKEAREIGTTTLPLSDTVARLWWYLTSYEAPDNPRKYIRSIGRIVTNLTHPGLWNLTVVPIINEERFVQIKCTGRTVAEEAEIRAPTARIDNILRQYYFQFLLTSFLDPLDALNFSVTNRMTRAMGVRLLPQVPLRVTEGSWTKQEGSPIETPPKPWQRLDVLVTPDVIHTVFVSYYVECKHADGDLDSNDHHAFGGMLVVRDDNRRLRPNPREPWGPAVVASCDVPPVSGSLVRLSFPHVPGRTYGLWHYSRGKPGSSLTVSDVRVRQLLHSCDWRGRSPLHMLLSGSVNDGPTPRLNLHVSMLLAAKFGTGDSVGDVPLHYALKCGVSEDVLQAIISASPAALVDTDKEGRTPMHAAFLLSKDEPPALGAIKALLTPPGENAIKLKDSSGRLPIHIASERGAGEEILRLLVDAYQDGCYRTNKDGDLPLHLLIKSGTATKESVELLIQPMMRNETISRIGGRLQNLPLHVACEMLCSFKVLEKLLQTYGEAAKIGRIERGRDEEEFALDLFEKARIRHSEGGELHSRVARLAVMEADFLLRSDLIFVYNPYVVNKQTKQPYRNDRERIRRIENVIRREAIQCGEDRKINRRAKLSDMATQGWVFLCTYDNPDDPSDNFAGTVRRILRGLQPSAVDVLAHVENPYSIPTPNLPLRDCATPVCKLLIMSRLRFVGRYVLYDEIHPVHKSESCLVMRARDHGLEDTYNDFMAIYKEKENQVEDDISDAGSEPPVLTDPTKPNTVTMSMFLEFASTLGADIRDSRRSILQLIENYKDKAAPPADGSNDHLDAQLAEAVDEISGRSGGSSRTKPDFDEDDDQLEVGREAFLTFCRANRLNNSGVRTVVIKFMKNVNQFRREIDVRQDLNLSGPTWPVVPIFDDYNVDRIEKNRKRDIDNLSVRDDVAEDAISAAPENKDELYALDIQEKNASAHNFALYKYAVVMPAGDRDLGEICQHDELGILQIRDYMMQVGNALKTLHSQSYIHGDLKMENVVRFGRNLALIDFDGTNNFSVDGADSMGGGSSKFCTGVLPPEMVCKVDLLSDYSKLTLYEDYWRRVSEDAKDLNLLTPDDIQTISTVVKSLLAKAQVVKNLGRVKQGVKTLRDEMGAALSGDEGGEWKEEVYSSLEDQNDWKDIISLALITISFEDLPFSLNRCRGVIEFSQVWNRLLFHGQLWRKLRPRVSDDEKFAYILKTHNDIPDEFGIVEKPDDSQIPYELLQASEKIDVWGFGVLLYALCSNGSLFHVGFDGDLRDWEEFQKLYGWDKAYGTKVIRQNVEDPLAQDLLQQILLPAVDRLPNMDAVLSHPFFGPSSNLEAQRILEKHEEEQLIIEETVVIKRMTAETRRKMDRSMERLCKTIFGEEKIVVPTCLIVLPCRLERKGTALTASDEDDIKLLAKVGAHVLDINKATARLSFWLMMKRSLAGQGKTEYQEYKSKLKDWQKRSRSNRSEVVKEVLVGIGCGTEYTHLCEEILTKSEEYVQAKEFLRDPMSTARHAIKTSTDGFLDCYMNSDQFLYLIDEINGVPVQTEESDENFDDLGSVYPISVDKSKPLLEELFLPFINIAVMKMTVAVNLQGLTRLLGIPSSFGIPNSWHERSPGLVHRREKMSSIAEFAVLHEMMRRQDRDQGNGSNLQPHEAGEEMKQLEDFFRDYDPVRTFSDLHRVSDGKENSPAIWTTEREVTRIQGELELASAEHRLRELKKEWLKKQEIQKEITALANKVERLRGRAPKPSRTLSSPPAVRPAPRATIPPSTVETTKPTTGNATFRGMDTAANGRPKRKKMRFRPFFGVC